MSDHPITPSLELVQQWRDLPEYTDGQRKMIMITLSREKLLDIATQAARWGATQELEACVNYVDNAVSGNKARALRAARRSKSPSLAKQGCDALDAYIYGNPDHKDKERTYNTIRAALERLKELEKGNE